MAAVLTFAGMYFPSEQEPSEDSILSLYVRIKPLTVNDSSRIGSLKLVNGRSGCCPLVSQERNCSDITDSLTIMKIKEIKKAYYK